MTLKALRKINTSTVNVVSFWKVFIIDHEKKRQHDALSRKKYPQFQLSQSAQVF